MILSHMCQAAAPIPWHLCFIKQNKTYHETQEPTRYSKHTLFGPGD